MRLQRATIQVVAESGYDRMSVASIVTRAGISSKTFYGLFDDRDGCYFAALDLALAGIATAVIEPLRAAGESWQARIRAALEALLQFLESDREQGVFVTGFLLGAGPPGGDEQERIISVVRRVLDEGATGAKGGRSPLAAEVVVRGALWTIDSRMRGSQDPLLPLANPLMSMIVLPYLGTKAATVEANRPPRKSAEPPPAPAEDPFATFGLRVTYRTVSVMQVISRQPGLSNCQIAAKAGISDQGQISKLLARLRERGLIKNTGKGATKGASNAWFITDLGNEAMRVIVRPLLAAGHAAA